MSKRNEENQGVGGDAYCTSGTSPGEGNGLSPRTALVRAAVDSDTQHGAVIPPIHLSSNFSFAGFGKKRTYDYTRSGNPTRDQLAAALAVAEGGAGAVVTSSGMSAVTLVLHLLRPGELVVAPHDCYGGTYRVLDALGRKGFIEVAFVDLTDAAAMPAALERRPRMVWIETPSNPLLRITDVSEVSRQAREVGALVVADNTFLSPVLQQPLKLGANIVVHSTTKYLNGHSDVVGGVAVGDTPELQEQLNWWGNCLGLTGAPFDSYLTLRGLRTLHVRMALHEQNARSLVDLLQQHPAVTRVNHPSLPTHPGHQLAAKQQSGFGAMLSFELSGDTDSVKAFLGGLELFTLAESLGGVESLVAHPATMTHAAIAPEARWRAGISDTLIRVSVGIEDVKDLERDLRRGLDRVRS